MDAEAYKRLISERDGLDHTTLNVTLKEAVSRQEYEVASEVQRVLRENKIPKPELSSKPYDTRPNYYKVDLSSDYVGKIIDMFIGLEESHVGEEGEGTPTSSFYGSLADKWSELA